MLLESVAEIMEVSCPLLLEVYDGDNFAYDISSCNPSALQVDSGDN